MLKTASLLAILPALTFAFFIPFPLSDSSDSNANEATVAKHIHIENATKPVKICSFVDNVDTVLCNNSYSSQENKNDSKEINNNFQNIKNEKNLLEFNLEMDPKDLCPLFELIDKSFCKSGKGLKVGIEKENIDPKDFCPLLELIETKLCS